MGGIPAKIQKEVENMRFDFLTGMLINLQVI